MSGVATALERGEADPDFQIINRDLPDRPSDRDGAAAAEIEPEIAGAAALARRILGSAARPTEVGAPPPGAAEEAERAIQFVHFATSARESLALNGSLMVVRREIDQACAALLDPLMDRLRRSSGPEHQAASARAEAAIRLAEIHLGPDYGAALRRMKAAALQPAAASSAG